MHERAHVAKPIWLSSMRKEMLTQEGEFAKQDEVFIATKHSALTTEVR
jgi:hypothetical protein